MGGHLALVAAPSGDGVLVCASPVGEQGTEPLRQRTGLLDAIFHSLNEGVMALDARQRIVAFRLSAERITGFAEAEVGRVCREVFQAPPDMECPFESMIRSGQGFYQREMVLSGKGGRPLHAAVNASLLREPGGVEGAVVTLRDLTELDRLRDELRGPAGSQGIVGNHPLVRTVLEKVEMVEPSEASILVLGESGTVTELVARAMDDLSGRARGPFVKVDCSALAETLLETELFGRVLGAFTGAGRDRAGRGEAADGGTLSLDEIGDTSPALQVKLLRVVQEGEFERGGDTRTRRADVRIVAVTSRDLWEEVREGRFREDPSCRLCVGPVQLPPLRSRTEDIPLLVDHFLRRLALREGRRKILSPSVYLARRAYPWPGNVRELGNAVSHAYVCTAADLIAPEALPEQVVRGGAVADCGDGEAEERRSIRGALEAAGWNRGEAARRLGLSRTTLWRSMRALGIRERRGARH